jgi:hypothetical protein
MPSDLEALLDLKYEAWKVAQELRKAADTNDLQAIKTEVMRLSARLKDLSRLAKSEASDKSSTAESPTENAED